MRQWKSPTCAEIICDHCRKRHRMQRHRFMCPITESMEHGVENRRWRSSLKSISGAVRGTPGRRYRPVGGGKGLSHYYFSMLSMMLLIEGGWVSGVSSIQLMHTKIAVMFCIMYLIINIVFYYFSIVIVMWIHVQLYSISFATKTC